MIREHVGHLRRAIDDQSLPTRLGITLGALLADVPHTRRTQIIGRPGCSRRSASSAWRSATRGCGVAAVSSDIFGAFPSDPLSLTILRR